MKRWLSGVVLRRIAGIYKISANATLEYFLCSLQYVEDTALASVSPDALEYEKPSTVRFLKDSYL